MFAEFEAKLVDIEFDVADEFVEIDDLSVSHSPPAPASQDCWLPVDGVIVVVVALPFVAGPP